MGAPGDGERRLSGECVAGPDDEVVEPVGKGRLCGRRGRRRGGSRRPGGRARRARPRAHRGLPGGPGAGSRCGELRRIDGIDPGGRAGGDLDLDAIAAVRLRLDAAHDLGEQAVADAIPVEGGRAEQTECVAVDSRDDGFDPRLQREGGHVRSESAQNAIPERRGGGIQFSCFLRILTGFDRFPIMRNAVRAEYTTRTHIPQRFREAWMPQSRHASVTLSGTVESVPKQLFAGRKAIRFRALSARFRDGFARCPSVSEASDFPDHSR